MDFGQLVVFIGKIPKTIQNLRFFTVFSFWTIFDPWFWTIFDPWPLPQGNCSCAQPRHGVHAGHHNLLVLGAAGHLDAEDPSDAEGLTRKKSFTGGPKELGCLKTGTFF